MSSFEDYGEGSVSYEVFSTVFEVSNSLHLWLKKVDTKDDADDDQCTSEAVGVSILNWIKVMGNTTAISQL